MRRSDACRAPGPGLLPARAGGRASARRASRLLVRARRLPRVSAAAAECIGAARACGRSLATVGGSLVSSTAFVEAVGFVLATVALLAFLFGALGRYRWPVALADSGRGGAGRVRGLQHVAAGPAARRPLGPLGAWTSSSESRSTASASASTPGNLFACFVGRLRGHAHRRAARHRSRGDDVAAAPGDLRDVARGVDHHAGRHLLRRHVRRIHDVDPRQHSRARPRRSSRASTATRWRAQGRAGPALGIAAFGSFIAGTLSVLGITLLAPPLARWPCASARPRSSPCCCWASRWSRISAAARSSSTAAMALLGMLLGTVGIDPISGIAALHLRHASPSTTASGWCR